MSIRQELERECNDLTDKIDQIMRTELITFDKIKEQTASILTTNVNEIENKHFPTPDQLLN